MPHIELEKFSGCGALPSLSGRTPQPMNRLVTSVTHVTLGCEGPDGAAECGGRHPGKRTPSRGGHLREVDAILGLTPPGHGRLLGLDAILGVDASWGVGGAPGT